MTERAAVGLAVRNVVQQNRPDGGPTGVHEGGGEVPGKNAVSRLEKLAHLVAHIVHGFGPPPDAGVRPQRCRQWISSSPGSSRAAWRPGAPAGLPRTT